MRGKKKHTHNLRFFSTIYHWQISAEGDPDSIFTAVQNALKERGVEAKTIEKEAEPTEKEAEPTEKEAEPTQKEAEPKEKETEEKQQRFIFVVGE